MEKAKNQEKAKAKFGSRRQKRSINDGVVGLTYDKREIRVGNVAISTRGSD